MPTIPIEISEDDFRHLESLVESCNETHDASGGANTHDRLNVPALISMLVEDATLLARRPGCWEAENIRQVLSSHGYDV